MRRAWVVIAFAGLVAAVGCGKENYEKRMNARLEQLKYERRVEKNLMKAPGDKKFQDFKIFIRPPKEEAQAKTGAAPGGGGPVRARARPSATRIRPCTSWPGSRCPRSRRPRGPRRPRRPRPRGEFVGDVLGVLATQFNSPDALQTPKFSDEVKKANRFKRLTFTANDKQVRLYTLKEGTHEVALVFVYDPKAKDAKVSMDSAIELALETFATGEKATRLYNGGSEEEPESGPVVPM